MKRALIFSLIVTFITGGIVLFGLKSFSGQFHQPIDTILWFYYSCSLAGIFGVTLLVCLYNEWRLWQLEQTEVHNAGDDQPYYEEVQRHHLTVVLDDHERKISDL